MKLQELFENNDGLDLSPNDTIETMKKYLNELTDELNDAGHPEQKSLIQQDIMKVKKMMQQKQQSEK